MLWYLSRVLLVAAVLCIGGLVSYGLIIDTKQTGLYMMLAFGSLCCFVGSGLLLKALQPTQRGVLEARAHRWGVLLYDAEEWLPVSFTVQPPNPPGPQAGTQVRVIVRGGRAEVCSRLTLLFACIAIAAGVTVLLLAPTLVAVQ